MRCWHKWWFCSPAHSQKRVSAPFPFASTNVLVTVPWAEVGNKYSWKVTSIFRVDFIWSGSLVWLTKQLHTTSARKKEGERRSIRPSKRHCELMPELFIELQLWSKSWKPTLQNWEVKASLLTLFTAYTAICIQALEWLRNEGPLMMN